MNHNHLLVYLRRVPVFVFSLCHVFIQAKHNIPIQSENISYLETQDLNLSDAASWDGDDPLTRRYNFFNHNQKMLPSVKTYTPAKSPEIAREVAQHKSKKHLTFIVYIAADNDLRSFAAKNIKQMAVVGSNNNVSIVVHLDIRIPGNKKITRRYLVLKEKIIHLNADDPHSQGMNSGDPKTLISCCKWAIESFPANEYALILWDHGTGVIEPRRGRYRTRNNLIYNPSTKKYELDRSENYFDYVDSDDGNFRAICFDDTHKSYLTGRDLQSALNTVVTKYLNGKKLAILGFDACLMSMLEIASLVKPYAKVMVGSQEVILGPGYDYKKTLEPLEHKALNYVDFSQHIIRAYHNTYNRITNDYTLAAVNLDLIEELEENVDAISKVLTQCLKGQRKNSVHRAIHASKSKLMCTHFDEPSFIDLDHFYHNLNENIKLFQFTNTKFGETLTKELRTLISQGRYLIKEAVFANTTGKNLQRAAGLSIYFPEKRMHSSYPKSLFAQNNHWVDFLGHYHHR